MVMGSLIAASSSFTFFAGFSHVFVQAGTMYSFDCSVERFLLSHCSDLFDPLQALCTLSAKDLEGGVLFFTRPLIGITIIYSV